MIPVAETPMTLALKTLRRVDETLTIMDLEPGSILADLHIEVRNVLSL
jgi:hypothetical protein